MKTLSPVPSQRPAFTLIELLVVIGIIGILAAMLLSAITRTKISAQVAETRARMAMLSTGINKFFADYNRYPVSKTAEQHANSINSDLTFGPPVAGSFTNNSEVVLILEDIDQGPNAGHLRNPRTIITSVGLRVSGPEPGVSTTDWIIRDPWRNPYVITLDLNQDAKCLDSFYGRRSVSQQSGSNGFNGLVNTDPGGNSDHFQFSGNAMIWSLGPDGKSDPVPNAREGVNKDNVLSWK